MSIIPRDCRKYIESDPTAECGCVQCKQDEETRRQITAQAPSTSKCCEKCYDPYSTQGYDITSPCGNPDCPCHTTHNQEERIVMTGADFTQKQRDAINLLVAQTIQEERERLAGLIEQKKRVNVVGSVAMYCLEGEGKAINDVLDEIIGQIPAK